MGGELILLILDSDDLGLDRWSRVGHGRGVRLILEVRMIGHTRLLPWMQGQVLSGVCILRVVRSWLEVLLWFPVAGVVCGLLRVLVCFRWVLLPVVRCCTLALRQGRTNRWP